MTRVTPEGNTQATQWRQYLASLAARKDDVERRAAQDPDIERLLVCFDALALRGVPAVQAARTASVVVAGLVSNQKAL